MSKELLRVTLSAKQVREACEEYVAARTAIVEPSTFAVGYDGDNIEVVISKKRERKPQAKEEKTQ